MGNILVLNFDVISSPSLKLKLHKNISNNGSMSWGMGWYPNDGREAILTKDPTCREAQINHHELQQIGDFRSTIFFNKIKHGIKGNSHHNTQPFSRSYAASEWLFSLVGKFNKNKVSLLRDNIPQSIEPLGSSGAELLFCYLMTKMQDANIRKLSELEPAALTAWCHENELLRQISFILTDGISVMCYQGLEVASPLRYHRTHLQNMQTVYLSDSAEITFDDPRDANHTALIFTNLSFNGEDWQELSPGQMLISRRATIVYDSLNNSQNTQIEQHAIQPICANQVESNFQSIQAEQAQIKQPDTIVNTNVARHIITNTRAITNTADGKILTYRLMDISHQTTYQYSNFIERSTHTFRLQPTEDAVQEVLHSSLTISVDGELIQYEDVFGNQSIHYTIDKPYNQLTIENKSRVKIYALQDEDHSLSLRQSSIPLLWMPWQRQMMMVYLLPEELPETQLVELTDYAMSFVERNDYHLLNTLEDINFSIYQDYTYVQGVTSLNSTAFDCYSSRKGVCQDFANLFICMARLLGIPARYRMGYINTGADYKNKQQSDASHAWVELYLPYLGWRGFDPTNGCTIKQDHIRVACGRNYRDATPTSGTIFKGGGDESLSVDVKIIEAQLTD